jgi:V-type H+-transporting ATPase subunit d
MLNAWLPPTLQLNIEIIRNTLYKAYLEDFTRFCDELGNASGENMKDILAFEADRRAFIITINSFDTDLTKDDRAKLFPKIGKYVGRKAATLRRGREMGTGMSLRGRSALASSASPCFES